MSNDNNGRMEDILAGCKSAEERKIMGLLPIFERDFGIVYNMMEGRNWKFLLDHNCMVTMSKGKLSLQQNSGYPDYSLLVTKDKLDETKIEVIRAYSICGERFFGNRSLEEFLRICGRRYMNNPRQVELCLGSISSLPSECLGYLKEVERGHNKADDFIKKVNANSSKFIQNLDITDAYFRKPEVFKRVFVQLGDEERKAVIKGIAAKKESRADLDKWMEELCAGLVEEALRERLYGED